MADEQWNGQTALVREIEELLDKKSITTSAAMRLMLKKELADIKANYNRDLQYKDLVLQMAEIQRHSIGHWIYLNPKLSLTIFIVSTSILNSEIRTPILEGLGKVAAMLIKAL